MPSAHMYSPGRNGHLYRLTMTNERCEIISDEYTFLNKYVTPTMARFENHIGGRIVVMAMTLISQPFADALQLPAAKALCRIARLVWLDIHSCAGCGTRLCHRKQAQGRREF